MITFRREFQVDICSRLVKMDAILQINLSYFSPHHKKKFVNSVNSLKKQFGCIGRNKKRQTCSTLLGLVCLTSTNQNQNTGFLWSDNCSLFTDYTYLMHLSLNMLICTTNSIMIYRIQCTVGYIVLSVLSKCWFRTLVPRKHFHPKSRLCEPGITWNPRI